VGEAENGGSKRAASSGELNHDPTQIESMQLPLKGRLELTWTNKDLALLAGEDGSYQWVKPTDHRVAEVRLLRDAGEVGDVHPDSERAQDNLLIRGDALNALEALNKLPEFAEELVGTVKLIYIDPPFNTGQAF
jgi:adenine-specific DNA-methyltransferase